MALCRFYQVGDAYQLCCDNCSATLDIVDFTELLGLARSQFSPLCKMCEDKLMEKRAREVVYLAAIINDDDRPWPKRVYAMTQLEYIESQMSEQFGPDWRNR